MSGYVTFLMGGREMAGQLTEVREVVRAVGSAQRVLRVRLTSASEEGA
jgi:hypothetical protein